MVYRCGPMEAGTAGWLCARDPDTVDRPNGLEPAQHRYRPGPVAACPSPALTAARLSPRRTRHLTEEDARRAARLWPRDARPARALLGAGGAVVGRDDEAGSQVVQAAVKRSGVQSREEREFGGYVLASR